MINRSKSVEIETFNSCLDKYEYNPTLNLKELTFEVFQTFMYILNQRRITTIHLFDGMSRIVTSDEHVVEKSTFVSEVDNHFVYHVIFKDANASIDISIIDNEDEDNFKELYILISDVELDDDDGTDYITGQSILEFTISLDEYFEEMI